MFLDTGELTVISETMKLGIFKGVTTNPTILLNEEEERFIQLSKIVENGAKRVFVQLVGDTFEELYHDFREIQKLRIIQRVGIKVPINKIGIRIIREIKKDFPNQIVLGTAIYSAEQGILSSLVGCDYIAPYVNRMSNNSIDPYTSIMKMRKFIDERNLKTEIMAASFKNSNQVIDSLMAGAHTATVSPDIIERMLNKELANQAIKEFNKDGKKLADLFESMPTDGLRNLF